METGLIRERYKVIRMLDSAPGYTFLAVVDILDREKKTCLLNVYEGDLRPLYMPYFDRLRGCPDFLEMFMDGEKLVLAFADCEGQTIDRVFCRGISVPWQTRLTYADLLFREALALADLPPAISCAAMLSENVFVDTTTERVRLRFKAVPMGEMNPRELALLTGDQMKKILLRRVVSPPAELAYLDLLDRGEAKNIVQMYGMWKTHREKIQAAYEEMEKKTLLHRGAILLWTNLKRWLRKKKRG